MHVEVETRASNNQQILLPNNLWAHESAVPFPWCLSLQPTTSRPYHNALPCPTPLTIPPRITGRVGDGSIRPCKRRRRSNVLNDSSICHALSPHLLPSANPAHMLAVHPPCIPPHPTLPRLMTQPGSAVHLISPSYPVGDRAHEGPHSATSKPHHNPCQCSPSVGFPGASVTPPLQGPA